MKRLIFITGSTETLEYFSLQLSKNFLDAGREVFLWDMKRPADSIEAFEKLPDPGESVLITFNFIGLSGEGQFSSGLSSIWDIFGIEKICIMVDSPVYYYRQLTSGIEDLKLVCIDRYHRDFLVKYYPEYSDAVFMPLAGNEPVCDLWTRPGILKKDDIGIFGMRSFGEMPLEYGSFTSEEAFDKWNKRRLDVLFIGNYVPLESLAPSLAGLDDDYKAFVADIAEDLIAHPSVPFETKLMERLTEEFPDCSDDEYLRACYQLIYVDLYVRNVYRGKIVTALADRGIRVHCTGKDWDKAPCAHPENLIHTGDSVVSLQCLQALSQAKISINMMPWFKAGAHDRVFSSMLSGCALVSDSSEYMDEILVPGTDYCRFDLVSPDETADKAAELTERMLTDEALSFIIAENGRKTALSGHRWQDRAVTLSELIS